MVINRIRGSSFIHINIPINKRMISSSIFGDLWPWLPLCMSQGERSQIMVVKGPGHDLTLVTKETTQKFEQSPFWNTHTQILISDTFPSAEHKISWKTISSLTKNLPSTGWVSTLHTPSIRLVPLREVTFRWERSFQSAWLVWLWRTSLDGGFSPPPKRKGESNLYIRLDLPQNPKSQFNSGLIGWIYASTKQICFLEIYLLIDSILKNTTPTSRELLL